MFKDLELSLASLRHGDKYFNDNSPIPFHVPSCWMRIEQVQQASTHSLGPRQARGDHSNFRIVRLSIGPAQSAFSNIENQIKSGISIKLLVSVLQTHISRMWVNIKSNFTWDFWFPLTQKHWKETKYCDFIIHGYEGLKGKFSSGLKGRFSNKKIGDLTGKQPCQLMYDNYNRMKISLFDKIKFKMAKKKNQKEKVWVKCGDCNLLVMDELRYIWYLICMDYVPCMLAPNLWHCWMIRNPYPF